MSHGQSIDQQTLTGDWGGYRHQLRDAGVDIEGSYTSEIANNPRGGIGEETRYTDQWVVGATFDLQKLWQIPSAEVQLTITDRNGQNLGDSAQLHTLQLVQEVWGRGQTWRLTQLWYHQALFAGRLDYKVGRLTVGEDFASFSCDFQNLTFCGAPPGNVRGDYWYNWPVSQWGARFKFSPNEHFYAELGVYQVNPRYIDDAWAEHNGVWPNFPAGTTGALIPLEVGVRPDFAGFPGTYKLDIWYNTSRNSDVFLNSDRQPLATAGGTPLQDHPYGVYLSFLQWLSSAEDHQGASIFFNLTQSDRDTATSIDRQVSLGMQYQGPFGRSRDSMGLAVGTNHVNNRVAQSQYLSNAKTGSNLPVPGSEYVAEVYYGWSPWHYLVFRPNVQLVVHPGGVSSYSSVLVLGLKTSVAF